MRNLTVALVVAVFTLVGAVAMAQQGKPKIVEVPKSKEFSLTPHGLADVSIKVIKSTNAGIVYQVINHGSKEDRVFRNATGGYYAKKMSPSQTFDLPYDISVPGTVSKGALLIDVDGFQLYATNMLTGMNKVKMAVFQSQ